MRPLSEIDHYRISLPATGWMGDHTGGAFEIPSPIDHKPLRVIASNGGGWDHVSVSRPTRTPTWGEMEHVKRLFFHDHETCMQLHVPAADHISHHPHTLHIWRPHTQPIPRPPWWMIGPLNTTERRGFLESWRRNRPDTIELTRAESDTLLLALGISLADAIENETIEPERLVALINRIGQQLSPDFQPYTVSRAPSGKLLGLSRNRPDTTGNT